MPRDLLADPDIVINNNAKAPRDLFADPDIIMHEPPSYMNQALHAPVDLMNNLSAGVLGGVQNLENYAHRIPFIGKAFPESHENFAQDLGVDYSGEKGLSAGKFIQGLGSYLPSAALGGGLASEAFPAGSALAKEALSGDIYGASQDPDNVLGGPEGAALNTAVHGATSLIGHGLGLMGATANSRKLLGNLALRLLRNGSEKGANLTPKEAEFKLNEYYKDQNGEHLPVDIGTLTNNPVLGALYKSTKPLPFTGTSKNLNTINKALANKESSNLTYHIKNSIDSLKQENSVKDSLEANKQDILEKKSNLESYINSAPEKLNSLSEAAAEQRTNIPEFLTQQTKNAYKNEQAIAQKNYQPLNNSKVRLDKLNNSDSTAFPNYKSAATELLSQRENLKNIFGTSSDLGGKLNKELDTAQNIFKGENVWGVTLPEIMTRMQSIGNLQRAASLAGERNSARLLGNLREGLSSDVSHILRKNNHEDLANKLDIATSHYKNNIVPFWKDNIIKKVVSGDEVPEGSALAKALHKLSPSNKIVFSKLESPAKKAALYQLITGGKGDEGFTDLTPDEIADKWKGLNDTTKTNIATAHPEEANFFKSLRSALNKKQEYKESIKLHDKKLKEQNKFISSLEKTLDNLSIQKEKFQDKYFGAPSHSEENKNKLGDILSHPITPKVIGGLGLLAAHLHPTSLMTTIPATLLARDIAKTLRDPELIKTYIKGGKLAANPHSVTPYAYSATALANALRNQGNQ